MARIRTIKRPTEVRVVIAGRLGAADMRRLEHACGPALTSERADLVVDLKRVTAIDGVAAAHLRYIATRGAVIRNPD
jgi:anti-anti-sigma regulatory factor